MVRLKDIAKFLDKELKIKKIKDSAKNGINFDAKKDIKKVGFTVDATLESFKKAKKIGCDLLIVHHAILWKGKRPHLKKIVKTRLNFLNKNKLSLYAVHLPLDLHPIYGNNISLAKILKLKNIKPFGKYHNKTIGYKGELKKTMRLNELAKILDKKLNTKSIIHKFNNQKIKKISIVSGSAGDIAIEAKQQKLDAHITGEFSHTDYTRAQDLKINVIAAGHYATETLGVKALMPVLKEKLGVEVVFIDCPTNL